MRTCLLTLCCLLAVGCGNSTSNPFDGGVGFNGPDGGPTGPGPDGGKGSPDGGTDGGPGSADGGTDGGIGFAHRPSLIIAENKRPGSTGWHLDNPSGQIAAYADRTSALPGDQVTIHAGAVRATDATWELWRIGYYAGAGGRLISQGSAHVPAWTPGVLNPNLGSVSAQWPATFSLDVPDDAVTGVFLVKLKSTLGDTYATFVVREPVGGASILYPIPTNTYQAYNTWGGTGLYANSRSDWQPWHAYAVSFDRPYQNNGAGEVMSMDRGLITFIEAQGYDVTYVTDADVDADPSLTADRRMIVYGAHTEYWTANMRDAARAAIAAGINVAFMGANSQYWQVRFSDASRRLLIGYKEFANLDPLRSSDPTHTTTRWRDPPLNLPENGMIGGMFGSWTWGSAPFTVSDPSSWLWAGTGLGAGSFIAGVYGTETDRRYDNGAGPANISVVADSLVQDHDANYNHGETTLYTSPAGGLVFNAGSITFTRAFANAGRWDARIQQLGANLFSKFSGDGSLPAVLIPMHLPDGLPVPQWRPGVQVSTVTSALTLPTAVAAAPDGSAVVCDQDRILRVSTAGAVSVVAGSTAGFADGAAAQAQFRSPRGVAVGPDGTIYVADSGNHRIRAIAAGVVRTVAGSDQGFADGSSPLFSQPMGIAVRATGTLLVADTWNQRVRELTLAGVATTWAGNGTEGITDGTGTQAALQFPMGITILPGGDAVIAEPSTGTLRQVSAGPAHTVSTLVGYPGDEGWADGPDGQVFETIGVAATADGQILLIDQASARIRALKAGTLDTLAGGAQGGTVDGAGANAGFGGPTSIAVAPDKSVLVVDTRQHTLRRITLP
jgi:N,N-dimethylformamidase beta subunit-like protein/NHL repeat-containing protein